MPIPIIESCKKRKRKPKLFSFQAFGEPNSVNLPKCPFRDKVRMFLQECAEIEDYDVQGMPIWCTLLAHESRSVVVPLYTIEEDAESSPRPYCDQCRCTGWSSHYVSKRKYHFVIPDDSCWNKPLDESVFEAQSHLLHGLIHCNGFGHLLSINGVEGGSRHLFGREIMDLWNRLCTALQARRITVADTSKKRNMELRLLHGVAYRHPWFGRWGYGFCHGSFGIKEYHYRSALDILCSLELDKIVEDFSETDRAREISQIVRVYRDRSETRLVTLNDLLKFMLTVKSQNPMTMVIKIPSIPPLSVAKPPASSYPFPAAKPCTRSIAQPKPPAKDSKPGKYRKFNTAVANMDSRWPQRRLEFAADVIVGALKEKKENTHFGNAGMTRQDVRDAARLHIGDTGLLDYVLKSLNNVLVGDQIVRREVNPATRILEYTITQLGNAKSDPPPPPPSKELRPMPAVVPGNDVYGDVAFLYKHVLMEYPEEETTVVESAVRTVLDTKHFVKEWPFDDEEDQLLAFLARMVGTSFLDGGGVGEVVYLPLHSTLRDLKEGIQCALRDTYCVTERVTVTEIDGLEAMSDDQVLFGAVESGAELRARVFGTADVASASGRPVYEGGGDAWKVACGCGAHDDDGERMVACDVCEVWQHTRCCGICDSEAVPPLFVCSGCCVSLAAPETRRRDLSDDDDDGDAAAAAAWADGLLAFDSEIDSQLFIGCSDLV